MQAHKYLTRHAEAEAQLLAQTDAINDVFDYALVLPCYDEEQQDIKRFASFCAHNNALLILVVNQPETVEYCDNNDKIIDWTKSASSTDLAQNLSFSLASGANILLIDRTQLRIPPAQGVGLARKIGADCACALVAQGIIKSPWIFSTDADACLPPDYFTAPARHVGCSAVIYPFEHIASGDDTVDTATALYELRLHHYVAGLLEARSPYAFHTLGSTLAIDVAHYAAAHGFPKRAGGEDFYLLNKLAKLAPVKSLQQPLLQLRARASHRVPFGTGPAVMKLACSEDMLRQPLFYHAGGFVLLKCWLDFFNVCADRICEGQAINNWRGWLAAHADSTKNALLLQTIDVIEFEAMLHKAHRQCRDANALGRYLHTWFDGFRTLKLLHALRDLSFPLQSFQQCFGDVASSNTKEKITLLNSEHRDLPYKGIL